ncbi:AAA family ATPase, partial [Streptomyces diastatochromogenes]
MGTYEPGTATAADGGTTLTAEIRRVLACVDAHGARAPAPGARGAAHGARADDVRHDDAAGAAAGPGYSDAETAVVPVAPVTAALDALVSCFGLTPFERDLVLHTAADELDPTTAP